MHACLPAHEDAPSHEEAAARPLRALALILAAGLAVRLGLLVWFAPLPIGQDDEKDYNALAVNLLERREFALVPGQLTSIRPPLYPALVAGVYALFGVENYQAVRVVQVLLSLVNVVVLYRLGRDAVSPRVGLWLAGLFCFYPSMLGMNNLLLTEVLFTLLLSAACWAVVLYYRRGDVWCAALAGALLALAALTRSVVWLAPPFLAVYLLVTGARGPFGGPVPVGAARVGLTRRLLTAFALLAAFAATLAPWAARNTRLQGSFVAVDVMSGRNFMMGNYAYTPLYRAWDAISLQGEQSWDHQLRLADPAQAPRSQAEFDKAAMKQGLRFAAANPGLTLKRDVVKFFDFWGLERELISRAAHGWMGPLPRVATAGLAVLILAPYVSLLFLGIFGAVMAPPDDRRVHWFLLAVIVFVTGAHTLVFGHSRYHLPLMPLVLLYAASAVVNARELWARRRSAAFLVAAALCGIMVVGWGWVALARDLRLLGSA